VTDTGRVTEDVRRHVQACADLIQNANPDGVGLVIAHLACEDAHLVTAIRIHLR
jgi:hypothetical protein